MIREKHKKGCQMNCPKIIKNCSIREPFTPARKLGKNTLMIHKFIEGAGLSDSAVVNNQDAIAHFHSGNLVCDYHCGASNLGILNSLQYGSLVGGIQSGGTHQE